MRIEEDRPRLNVYKNLFLTYGLFYCFRSSFVVRRRRRHRSMIPLFHLYINIRYSENKTFFFYFLPIKLNDEREKIQNQNKNLTHFSLLFLYKNVLIIYLYYNDWLIHILFVTYTYIHIFILFRLINEHEHHLSFTILTFWFFLISFFVITSNFYFEIKLSLKIILNKIKQFSLRIYKHIHLFFITQLDEIFSLFMYYK